MLMTRSPRGHDRWEPVTDNNCPNGERVETSTSPTGHDPIYRKATRALFQPAPRDSGPSANAKVEAAKLVRRRVSSPDLAPAGFSNKSYTLFDEPQCESSPRWFPITASRARYKVPKPLVFPSRRLREIIAWSTALEANDLKSLREEAPLPTSMIHWTGTVRKQKRKIRSYENRAHKARATIANSIHLLGLQAFPGESPGTTEIIGAGGRAGQRHALERESRIIAHENHVTPTLGQADPQCRFFTHRFA